MDLYFERHDGQAVTCDDFRQAMADANGVDLADFDKWYSQAGTPQLVIKTEYSPASRTYTIQASQSTPPSPGQPTKEPVPIPIAVGLLRASGQELPLRLQVHLPAPSSSALRASFLSFGHCCQVDEHGMAGKD